MTQPVAIITGASSGIGRATAVELDRHGYRLVLVARSPEPLAQAAAQCQMAITVPADVSEIGEARRIVDQALAKWGQVDALVHAAGLAPLVNIEAMTPAQWQAVINTNLTAGYFLCRALWPHWKARGAGVAVNVSSVSARDPFVGLSAYAAAKGGLNAMGLALAREGAPFNIRVHTVAPGAVETPMLRAIFSQTQLPSAQALEAADVARVIAQCVWGDMVYTSGEVIYVRKTP